MDLRSLSDLLPAMVAAIARVEDELVLPVPASGPPRRGGFEVGGSSRIVTLGGVPFITRDRAEDVASELVSAVLRELEETGADFCFPVTRDHASSDVFSLRTRGGVEILVELFREYESVRLRARIGYA